MFFQVKEQHKIVCDYHIWTHTHKLNVFKKSICFMDGLHFFFYFCTFLSEEYSSNLFRQPFQLEILSYVRNRYFSHNSAMWYCIFSLSLSIHAKAEILKCFTDHSCGVVKGNHVRRISGFLHLTERTRKICSRAEECPSWIHTWPGS